MILIGIRSPMIVEYEETCLRAAVEISACINVTGTPRNMLTDRIVELADFDASDAPFLPCAFSPTRREELFELGCSLGLEPTEALVDPTAIVASSARIGEASFVNAGAVIGAMSLLGRAVLINRAASVGHHTFLSDFVSLGPGATLAGNIRVGRGAIIGVGAVVLPNIRIGADAIVAAGSVVRRDVADGTTVAGNPAVPIDYNRRKGSLNVDGEE